MTTRILLVLAALLCGCGSPAPAAILVQGANGTYTLKSTLAEAAVAADAAGKSVLVTTALSAVQSNISSATLHAWPTDRTLQFSTSGSIANTTVFRHPGSTKHWPEDRQLFTGAGRVYLPTSRPEWFGAVMDDLVDDYAATQKAFNYCKEVLFRKGVYLYGTNLVASSTMLVKRVAGEGPLTILRKTVDTVPYVIAVVSATDVTIENLAGDGVRSTTADYTNSNFVFYLAGAINCVVNNVHAYGALSDNIVVEYGKGNKVVNSWSYNCNKDGIYSSGSEAIVISGNHSYGNGSNSTGGGIAVAATWGAAVTSNICYDNVQFDILLSRGTRFATVTGNSNGPFTSGQAPIGLYVLGEGLGGTLHGFDYGDGTLSYGASDCQISANTFQGELRLELLASSTVSNNTVYDPNEYAINCMGCTGNTITGNITKNYSTWGLLLNSTAKNGTVQSDLNVIGPNYYDDMAKTTHNNGTGAGNIYNDVAFGAWTPVVLGASTAGTYEIAGTARYHKVGRQVTLIGNIALAASITGGGSGNLRIAGIPFARNTSYTSVGAVMLRGVDFTGVSPVVRFVGASEVYFPVTNDNGAEVAIDIAGVAATDAINFTITYEAAEP